MNFLLCPKPVMNLQKGSMPGRPQQEGCCMHTSPCCCFQMLPDARERCDSSTLHIYFASFTSCLYCLLLHHSSFLLFPILSASHAWIMLQVVPWPLKCLPCSLLQPWHPPYHPTILPLQVDASRYLFWSQHVRVWISALTFNDPRCKAHRPPLINKGAKVMGDPPPPPSLCSMHPPTIGCIK